MSLGILQDLKIGVDGQELDTRQAGLDHAAYGVAARSSDTGDLDVGQPFDVIGILEHHAARLLHELGRFMWGPSASPSLVRNGYTHTILLLY